MEKQTISPGKFAVNYGLILGVIMVVIAIIMYASDMILEGKQWPQYLYYIIFPVVIIYAISQYKKNNANILSLSDSLKVGVIIAIISGLVYMVYGVIFNYFIDPEFIDKVIETTREKMLENPNMTEEAADKGMKFVEMFSNPFLTGAFWIALSAFFGLIYSLIGGLAMKKEA